MKTYVVGIRKNNLKRWFFQEPKYHFYAKIHWLSDPMIDVRNQKPTEYLSHDMIKPTKLVWAEHRPRSA